MAPRNVFTQHHTAPALSSPLLRHLCENWTRLNAAASSQLAVRSWAAAHPSLGDVQTLGDVVDRVHSASPRVQDTLLRVLLELVAAGEQLAGAALLQQMLPTLAAMPNTLRAPTGEYCRYEDRLHIVLAAFWEVAATAKPLTRPGVAGRLRMDTLHLATAHRRSTDVWNSHVDYNRDDERFRTSGAEAADRVQELLELLTWARDSAILTAAEAQFLGEVYLIDGGDQKAAATRLGHGHAATRQRVTRLRHRLCAAVTADAQHRDLLLAPLVAS